MSDKEWNRIARGMMDTLYRDMARMAGQSLVHWLIHRLGWDDNLGPGITIGSSDMIGCSGYNGARSSLGEGSDAGSHTLRPCKPPGVAIIPMITGELRRYRCVSFRPWLAF